MSPLCKQLKENGGVLIHSEFRKDAHDVAASTIIEISRGPPTDPRFFYATTHSTTYRPVSNPALKGPINGLDEAYLKMRMNLMKPVSKRNVRQGTGYSKNVLPYVEYDKEVDEGPTFSNPQNKSVTMDHYQYPQSNSSPLDKDLGIAPMVASGFTRLPKFSVVDDGTCHHEKVSQMKSSFSEKRLRFKSPVFEKSNITPSGSAFTNDVGEIKYTGDMNESGFQRVEQTLPPAKDWRANIPTNMTDDGYSRSTRPTDPLKGGQPDYGNPKLLSEKAREFRKRRDPAEWVHEQDPLAKQSLSRVIHVPLDPLGALKSLNDSSAVKVGMKEPTGAVQNNPKYVFVEEISPSERFSTETERRFKAPIDPFSFNKLKCNYVTESGFTTGNNFRYTNSAKPDHEIYRSMHPTVARHNWIRDRGIHTVKPNRSHMAYELATN
ncbi:hypothetical protein HDU97_001105 [Phlyctochytrium planicorne]|nr:hypothetical protein HDU97_001105 [Phlyctochytrium planicorne]